MNIRFHLLLAGTTWLLATSCVSTEREASVPGRTRTEYIPPSGQGRRVSSATVLNTVRTSHVFSNGRVPDSFVLQLRGPRVLTGQLHFSVVNAQGDTLRHEVLPARVLLDPQAVSARDQEISVLRGMNTFFSASHFVAPAVSAATRPPVGMSPATWASLQNNSRIVGFDYPGASGAEQRLVYASQLGQALVLSQ